MRRYANALNGTGTQNVARRYKITIAKAVPDGTPAPTSATDIVTSTAPSPPGVGTAALATMADAKIMMIVANGSD